MNGMHAADDGQWGGRLPLIDGPDLTGPARSLSVQLHKFAVPFADQAGFASTTEDGRLIGLWNTQLHRPALAEAFNRWVQADQRHSTLSPRVREVVMLTVGAAWHAEYMTYSHVAGARTTGLSPSMIACLLDGEINDEFGAEETAAHAFADTLARRHVVTEAVYNDAVRVLGHDGVLDLVHLTSLYLATAAQLNAFQVPAPPIESSTGVDRVGGSRESP